MAYETELKYLVTNNAWLDLVKKTISIEQGFLTPASKEGTVVRVRVKNDQVACLTVKGPTTLLSVGIPTKPEYEYEIPLADGLEMMQLCDKTIRKVRHLVEVDGYTWEVDVFKDELAGLVVAELEDNGALPFPPNKLPGFVGADVSVDRRYLNYTMAYEGLPNDASPSVG